MAAVAAARANLRLFVAAYPPAEVAKALLEALGPLELPPHRLLPVEQVHLTLHFIGDTPAARLQETIETIERAGAGLPPFTLSPNRLITLPRRGLARLVAAEAEGPPALLELQRRLASRLAQRARDKPWVRFLPHMTLCRFKSPARAALDEPVEVQAFRVDRVVLMKSDLTPHGALHHEVAACLLEA